ncbi:hypothetical protein Ssi02_31120 [Sinosporangium siamense]|uniref:Uncharacterized protein n=1 Tax=Sinosporangium siamense TaxID=1367973 RepID=A0A919V7A4_9ACTN|nr:hypothetical protein Ssi02_31120 [Sinosporangium siamense]
MPSVRAMSAVTPVPALLVCAVRGGIVRGVLGVPAFPSRGHGGGGCGMGGVVTVTFAVCSMAALSTAVMATTGCGVRHVCLSGVVGVPVGAGFVGVRLLGSHSASSIRCQ